MFRLAILCLIALLAYRISKVLRRLPVPPGPRGLPVFGSALEIPKECSWLTFAQWAKTYGPIMHVSCMTSSIIVLSSREAIIDLLEKKNAVYSDRPIMTMAGELAGLKRLVAFAPYGQRHREGRKLITGALGPRKAPELHAIQEAKTLVFISRLTESPAEFRTHIRWLVASIVLEATYGITIDSYDDPFLLEVEKSLAEISDVSAPGAYLVDAIPSLKYVPEWFPAASFKRIARETRERSYALEDKLYQAARRQLDRGSATPSFVADLLKHNYDPTQDDHTLYAEVAVMFYGAGADTTVSSILSFFLIMATHPDIQRKAQAEVDSVTSGRLPICSDREDMPYLGAVLKEVHRCNPVLPLALPHYVREEDVYAGYRIPAGSTILPNTWAILHDPELYPHPDEVIPERYYDCSNGDLNPDPQDFAFGYGRRVCPGRTLAEDTLFIVAASVLASFNITSVVPLKGETIEYRGGAISHPDDFACGILPRRST